MKTRNFLLALALLATSFMQAQKLQTRNGFVKFFSEAPLENIEARNNQVSSVVDLESGKFAFLVPIKGFVFEKALMQDHFNERYLESSKYPNGTFKGEIKDVEKVNLSKDGEYPVIFTGSMSIHGVDRDIEEEASIIVKNGKASLKSVFQLRPEDYNVEIPASKRDNISETLEVTVEMDYETKEKA